MANNHSTGYVRPCKIPTEKQIKVAKTFYPHPPKNHTPYKGSRAVPWIQMRGLWLEAAGFSIDTPIKVRIMPGCLVLTALEQGERS